MDEYAFHRFGPADSLEELTGLLHRAYAEHAAAGRKFFATYQTVEDTRRRISKGECWLAVYRGVAVGTVTLRGRSDLPAGYPAPANAGGFSQLAVLPEYRGAGLGSRLLGLAERRIDELGTKEIVIDTSSLAIELVGWYERRGYAKAGMWKWKVTNYESVVLRKTL